MDKEEIKLKLDYAKTKKLLDKLKIKWKNEPGNLKRKRLYRKIEVLSSRLVDIRESLQEMGSDIDKPPTNTFYQKTVKNDILNLKPAGSDKLNPDGTLPKLVSNYSDTLKNRNYNELITNYKILPDGSLFSFDKVGDKYPTNVSG
jgi:hypothetical protein